MSYSKLISYCHNIEDIVSCCHKALPDQYKRRPWTHPELMHGVGILSNDHALNCYMSAYGDMHIKKCRAAMMNFPFDQLQGNIEIIDWGCGQGIGSATVIEFLQQRNLFQWLRKITLIEPSEKAIDRAFINIRQLTHDAVEIDIKNQYLPTDNTDKEDILTQIGYRCNNIIHIFSNILDVPTINLGAVAQMVASAYGRHFILCIGPKNSAEYRMQMFCSVFGDQEYFSRIDSVCYGRTNRTAHSFTCMTRCFIYNGAPIDLSKLSQIKENKEEIYDEYDLRLQIQNKIMSRQKARIAWRLENILSIDDIMYVDAVINEVAVDFIIIRPNKGVLLVNVVEDKLDKNYNLQDKKLIEINGKTYKSPIDLIGLCQISIKDAIEELLISSIEDKHNFSLIKKVVIFSENSIEDVKAKFGSNLKDLNYTWIFGNEFIEDRNTSFSLYKTINFLYNNKNFDGAVMRKLARIISPSWHSYQEGRVDIQPIGVQKRLSESRKIQQKISGVAGSGKTQVLVFRAINAMKRTGGNVLVLTYNITLANYLKFRMSEIREDFSWEKIDIYHYHQFFKIRAVESKLHVDFGSYDIESFFDKSKIKKKYSAIFVDEVQDYTTEWLRIISRNFLLEPDGEFVVFGDPKQNIYGRNIDKDGDIKLGVISGMWNKQLTTSKRFTNPRLANLATLFQNQFMNDIVPDTIKTENIIYNTLNFQIIKYIDMRDCFILDNLVDNIINIISNDNHDSRDFVVLASSKNILRDIDIHYRQRTNKKTEITFAPRETVDRLKAIHRVRDERNAIWPYHRDLDALERTRKQLFTTDKRCLKIATIQSFKGWESPAVIVLLEDKTSSKIKSHLMSPQAIYTAITRARENLYIINIGNDSYHNFFNNQI